MNYTDITDIATRKKAIQVATRDLLQALGLDLCDVQLEDTPRRVANAWIDDLATGLFEDPPPLTCFPNQKGYDEMVVLGPIEVKSICSHHLMPFYGKAWVGYIPGGLIVGLSKLARVVHWFSRRPQIQEGLTIEIADFLIKHLAPVGVGVYIRATHTCMTLRGVNEAEAVMSTSAIRGAFFEKPEVRAEFFQLVHDGGGR